MNKDIYKVTAKYCIILKRCLQYYHERSVDKSRSHTHIRRGLLFLQEFPDEGMKLTGVKLWKYREIVNSGNLGKIKKIATLKTAVHEAPQTQQDIASGVIENVMETWRNAPPEDKESFTQQVQELLKLYTERLWLEKQLKGSTDTELEATD